MKNPCEECLVSPCCSRICEQKQVYTHYIILQLTVILDEGKRFLKPESYDKIMKLCEENMNQTHKIYGVP